jgi:hypothetical protein
MVAIPATDESEIDLDKLVLGVMKELPAYARPIFVRLVKEKLDLTGKENIYGRAWEKEPKGGYSAKSEGNIAECHMKKGIVYKCSK